MNTPGSPDVYDEVTSAVTAQKASAHDERLTAPGSRWITAVLFGISMAPVF